MKTRILHTQFWEDEYIVSLEKEGKLIFNYLLTNKRVSVAGIYEIPDVDIVLYTGCELSTVKFYLQKFVDDHKIKRFKNWVRLINFDVYNSYNGSDLQVAKDNILKNVPEELLREDLDTSVQTSPDSPIYNNIYNNINNNIIKGVHTSPDTSVDTSLRAPRKPFKFVKPTVEEIEIYCKERNNNINSEAFFNYYESNGWKVGKNAMKNWKAAIITWEKNNYGGGSVRANGSIIGETDKYKGH